MADFIFDEFKDDTDVVHIRFKEKKSILSTILKWVRLKLGNKRGLFNKFLFDRGFVSCVSAVTPRDRVLLWSIENLKTTLLIAKEIDCENIQSFLWNPMFRLRRSNKEASHYVEALKKCDIVLSTFDPVDSRLLKCRLMPQVHRRLKMSPRQNCDFDVFFVGQLKGRESVLSGLVREFTDSGISYYFHLVVGRHYKADVAIDLKYYIHDNLMSYEETLANISKARCILDLSQKGQTGLTLRPVEAMMYGKKLITNNHYIKKEPLYDANNVWIIGDKEEKRSIVEFLNDVPYRTASPQVARHYDIRYWLDELWGE